MGLSLLFKSDVYFVNTKLSLIKNGAPKTLFGLEIQSLASLVLEHSAPLLFKLKIQQKFLREVSGTNRLYKVKQVQDQLISFVNSNFNNIVAKQGVAAIDLTSKIDIVEQAVNLSLKEEFSLRARYSYFYD